VSKKTKITNERYEKELFKLQLELVKLQAWINHMGLKVVVLPLQVKWYCSTAAGTTGLVLKR
jgi:polyphosphate kinase 2 (PPK2 family)